MLDVEELSFELRQALRQHGRMTPDDMPHAELYMGLIGNHLTCSPGAIIPLVQPAVSSTRWPAFVRKVGRQRWLLGGAAGSTARREPGVAIDLDINLSLVFRSRSSADVKAQHPHIACALHRLFDQDGRQRSFARQPTSDVLTPTGLPIETHGEMVAHRRPDGRRAWNLGGTGIPVPHMQLRGGDWQIANSGLAKMHQVWRIEIPAGTPAGRYGIRAMIGGVGEPRVRSGRVCCQPETCPSGAAARRSVGADRTRAAVVLQPRDALRKLPSTALLHR
jgi:hypothetical protein